MTAATVPLAVLRSPLFREHYAQHSHPECPERLIAAEAGLNAALATHPELCVVEVTPRAATREELLRAHSSELLSELDAIRGRTGHLDGDTFFSAGSLEAAEHAAGGALALVDTLLDGRAQLGLGLVRPPGHHATREQAMGFCLLNNVALAAAHALARGKSRVLIFDWDVHHGNGTQDIFYGDPRVLFCSTHQFPWYPGTGRHSEVGEGKGRGFTVNVPLSAGATDAVELTVVDTVLLPLLRQYQPELILVSAGYDAHRNDPLGGLRFGEQGYGALSQRLSAVAHELGVPIALLLEGGYDLSALQGSLCASVGGLALGARGQPLAPESIGVPGANERDIEQALGTQRQFWTL
ncbi:MAG TPA: histone deacetylase [Polyangiaceae bacterium]|nr:histone deacetylase [Polyangiaceae bacterium]